MTLACFKAYDIRGRLGSELNNDIAYRIGRAFGQYLKAKTVAVGGDIRLSSEELKASLASGLQDAGVNVVDLGMTGTEEIYFAAFHLDVDGAIEVTASHNPMDYNGMKLVSRGAKPISSDNGLNDIRELVVSGQFTSNDNKGSYTKLSLLDEYVDHLMTYINIDNLKPMKLVVNAGNGAAGHVIDEIEDRLKNKKIPIEFIKIHHEPDGNFPNGIPNPLLPENRAVTADAVRINNADMGIAWDGDFDRCFLFDENGDFIEGYYIVGLLAEAFLMKHPGEKIIHDPRLTWNTVEVVKQAGGIPIQSRTGHAFIKDRMRSENAIYGGEMSAHHYFRDFAYCDSGMIPWLLVMELLSSRDTSLSKLVGERIKSYPCSGEINYKVKNAKVIIENIEDFFKNEAVFIDHTDGLSIDMADWRFNIRTSNTEPLLRLNIESRALSELVWEKVSIIEKLINS
ncbi:Phosphomannomutase [Dickeya parazeae Ech586]|uniref:Phosphomannomutase n=1 Tax=Dickeya zeae (strain Ech586) TaxID=590409 RepID=D2BSC7_DICZ5|nr:phosphomannomutase/phosphoglucomutase [Dickeya parazeae]ACZ75546.1 Phosphomannomutase [Dickeya parazeae Ech586]